jgi:hypothetical protein
MRPPKGVRIKLGRKVLYNRAAFLAWVEQGCPEAELQENVV